MRSSISKYGLQFKILILFIFLCEVNILNAQTSTVVLPTNGNGTQSAAPQGSVRFQRGFYLIKPSEVASSGLANAMSINSIGFTIGAAQSDTTKGAFKVYLQNTTDTVSRRDTNWTTIPSIATNQYALASLFPGNYEWQVKTNCSPYSPVTNFSNQDLPVCRPVTSLKTTNITSTSARFNWVAPAAGAIKYYVDYRPVDVETWSEDSTDQLFYNTPATLEAAKNYKWRVRVRCAENFSSDEEASFFTDAGDSCAEPSSLSVTFLRDTLARVTWTGATGAAYYNIRFRRVGTTYWFTTQFFNTADSIRFGLVGGTTYEWQVQTKCATGVGAFVSGPNFTTLGTTVCYTPEDLSTNVITENSANLTWQEVSGATYELRYRLKDVISWNSATTGMILVHNDSILIPDTIGRYSVPFEEGLPFTYDGGGIYVAWEYERSTGPLTTPNTSLITSGYNSLKGYLGQDSIRYRLSYGGESSRSLVGLDEILNTSDFRPETTLGSNTLIDSSAVLAVYALGSIDTAYTSDVARALIHNYSSSEATYDVSILVKEKNTNTERYSAMVPITIPAASDGIVSFPGWIPSINETDSIIISIPARGDENVVNNNRNHYLQTVTRNAISYADDADMILEAGTGPTAGLTLSKHFMKGCGKVNAAQVYLTSSAKNQELRAVVRNVAGAIVAQSPLFTPDSSQTNKYYTFFFETPYAFYNEDYYIGILQPAGCNPVGSQWEFGNTRSDAYFRAAADGSALIDSAKGGRLMIKALIAPSAPEVSISGNTTICTGSSTELSAGSSNSRYANNVIAYSSQNDNDKYSARQALGSPDVKSTEEFGAGSWVSVTPDGQREFIELSFAGADKINYVDIYETINGGAVDTVSLWNPDISDFTTVFTTTATTPTASRKNRITFPTTTYDVSRVRIALRSDSVSGFNGIDAVGIGKLIQPGVFSTYLWSPGAESTSTLTVTTPGVYALQVLDANGCGSTDSITVKAAPTVAPVITAFGSGTFCIGDSIKLKSSFTAGNLWSNGSTADSIIVRTAGNYTVSYNDGSGCTVLESTAFTVVVNALPTPSISGSTDICVGNSNTLTASSGFTNYLWNTGQTGPSISVGVPATYTVKVTDGNGCKNTTNFTTVFTTLAAPTITGTLSFCPGGSTVLDAGAGYTSYNWSNGQNTRTITVSTAGTFSVVVSNANGCTASQSVLTNIFTSPTPQITGNNGYCAGGSTTLTATPGFVSYLWSNTQTSPSITINTVNTYTVTVIDGNGCSGSASRTTEVYPNPTPVISGTLSFCGGTSTTLNAGSGYSSYLWSSGETTQAINVTTVGTSTVTVTNIFGCSASTFATTSLTGVIPVTPGPISGPATRSCNTTGAVYSVAFVANTSHYVWTMPSGATITAGEGTNSITVSFSPAFQGGNIIVAASNACGQSPSLSPRRLFVQSLTNTPGNITGQRSSVCGPVTRPYSVANVASATSYTWTVPTGASIVSGQGTRSISVLFSAGFSNGNICVTANNACGSSAPSCAPISGVPPTPGAISGATIVCINQRNLSYGVVGVAGATSYTWTVPQSASIAFGQGSNNIIVNMGPNAGNITVRANSTCGTSTLSTLAVTLSSCIGTTTNGLVASTSNYSLGEIRPVPEVVSNYGGFTNSNGINLEWTVGEPRVEAITNGMLFTEGFHQPQTFEMRIKKGDSSQLFTDNIKVTAFPNPVTDVVRIKIETENSRQLIIELLDGNNRLLQRRSVQKGLTQVDLVMARYTSGDYFLVVTNTEGKVLKTIKLLKAD